MRSVWKGNLPFPNDLTGEASVIVFQGVKVNHFVLICTSRLMITANITMMLTFNSESEQELWPLILLWCSMFSVAF